MTSHASQNGRNGFSGNPSTNGGATCTICHAPGAAVSSVSISGPTVVGAGTTNADTVTITGGPAGTERVNLSVSDFAGLLEPSDLELHLIENELSHTAPEYNTDVTLYAAGNSSTDQRDLMGDGIKAHTLNVTVQNGTPPPEPPPPVGDIQLEEYVTGLNAPVAVTHAGDQRLFIAEQAGHIRIIDGNGNLLPRPFLDIANRVDNGSGEMGLLGLAFHPNYAANGYFYVYYTRDLGSGLDRSRVARFQVSVDPNIADENSELVIVEFAQPFSNHNGGDVHFGPDGYLYIASGDGGSVGDPQDFAQNSGVLLGKLLRVDVDGAPGANDGPDCDISGHAHYRVPARNAFNDGIGGQGCDEIYATGLRNPWRFSFDRQTGDLWIADVGQGAYEEINLVSSGAAGGLNFGWRCYEGNNPFNPSGCTGQYFFPLYVYAHAGGNCSVTGGFVYRGSEYPKLDGHYFFTDFCNTAIHALSGPSNDPVVSQVLPSHVINTPSTFGEDVDGELYIASLSDGRLYKIRGQPTNPLPINNSYDLDGDGKADIVWRNTSTAAVAAWLMNGTTIASVGFPGSAPGEWQIKGIGDVNGDGKADLIWKQSSLDGVAIWLMNGSTISSVGFLASVPSEWEIEEVGDVNGDEKADLVWRNQNSGLVGVWLMNGTTITSVGFPASASAEWQIEGLGDVNGDGKADLIWQHTITGTVVVWLMNGPSLRSVGFPASTPTDWKIQGVGDLNGDGKADLVWQNENSHVVAVWLMNGPTIASVGFSGNVPSEWEIEQVSDVNGDGKVDVVWQHTNGTVAVWVMNGTVIESVGFPANVSSEWELQP
jgi:glucose/arabinose dehydrogenase